MTERQLINAILLAHGARADTRLWRNEVATATVRGRTIQAGLCTGSADLIGIHRGLFVAIEVKTPRTRLTKQQQRFLDTVRSLGGIAGVARSVADVDQLIGGSDD